MAEDRDRGGKVSEPRGSGAHVDMWITAGLMICEGPEENPYRRWWRQRLEERGLHCCTYNAKQHQGLFTGLKASWHLLDTTLFLNAL